MEISPLFSGESTTEPGQWSGDGLERSYGFQYDSLNRLTNAYFSEWTGAWSNSHDYSVSGFTYELNGNILSLNRQGVATYGATPAENQYGLMDGLTYTYSQEKGNQLIKVEDYANTEGKGNDFKNGSVAETEYFYDSNGNFTKDLNKGIDTIYYNHMNLMGASRS